MIITNMERIDLLVVKHEELYAQIYQRDDKGFEVFIFGEYPNSTVNESHPNKDEALKKAMILFGLKNNCIITNRK